MAVIDTDSNSNTVSGSKQAHSQIFATGEAATHFARRNNAAIYEMMTKSVEKTSNVQGDPATEDLQLISDKAQRRRLEAAEERLQTLLIVAARRKVEAAKKVFDATPNDAAREKVEAAQTALDIIRIEAVKKEIKAAKEAIGDGTTIEEEEN